MSINPEIQKILRQYNIPVAPGLLYLLTLYHELEDGLFSEVIKKQINLSKIVERDYSEQGKLIWNIPLYSSEIISDQWDWIQGWRNLFGKLRNDAIGDRKGCLLKMKKFFAEHPEVRMDDVLKATMMYLNPYYQSRTGFDVKFLQRADYFISKSVRADGGVQFTSRLEMYLEIMKKDTPQNEQVNKQLNQVIR